MKRSKEAKQFLVYKYHCYPQPCGEKGNHWQPTPEMMTEAVRVRNYWNKLVLLAQENRKAYFAILDEDLDLREKKVLFEEAKIASEEARTALRTARKKHRKKNFPDAPFLEEAVQRTSGRLRETYTSLKDANGKAKERKRGDLDILRDKWNTILRKERKDLTMGWGNREDVLDHFKTAVFATRGGKSELRLKGHIDQVNFTQPYTSGIAWAALKESRGERVSIGDLHEARSKNQAPRYDWSIKIDREILVPLQVAYSRPIPKNAIIRSVRLHGKRIQREWMRKIDLNTILRKFSRKFHKYNLLDATEKIASIIGRSWSVTEISLGGLKNEAREQIFKALQKLQDAETIHDQWQIQYELAFNLKKVFGKVAKSSLYVVEKERWRWSLHVTLEVKNQLPKAEDGKVLHREQRVGVNIGWLKVGPWEIRAAMAMGSDGQRHELRLPEDMMQQYAGIRKLTEDQSLADNALGKELEKLPLINPTEDQRKIRDLAIREPNVRTLMDFYRAFAQDRTYATILREWYAKRSRHANMIAGSHRRLRNWRTDIYRKWARKLCLSYEEILIGDINLKAIAEQEDKNRRIDASMRYRQIVGPSFLLIDLTNMAKKLLCTVTKTKAAFNSAICPVCAATPLQKSENPTITCPNGHEIDQDEVSCLNYIRAVA